MANSIKLDNDQYVDATGVYDSTRGETQASINSRFFVKTYYHGATGSFTINLASYSSREMLVILDNGGIAICSIQYASLVGSYTNGGITVSVTDGVLTVTGTGWYNNTLLMSSAKLWV